MSKFRQRCPQCNTETVVMRVAGVLHDICPRCRENVDTIKTPVTRGQDGWEQLDLFEGEKK